MSLADIRKDYIQGELNESQVATDPLVQFQDWFAQAQAAQVLEVNAMTLSTVSTQGHPSSRIVLLKDLNPNGFTFFTNYLSRKGQELEQQKFASLLFFWPTLERQIRIEGSVQRVSDAESDQYFHSRPVGSQIGAWVSEQSQVIPNREHLAQRQTQFETQFANQPPRPPHWGGYCLSPDRMEFWQGRSSRLHDRLCYTLNPQTGWDIVRLAP